MEKSKRVSVLCTAGIALMIAGLTAAVLIFTMNERVAKEFASEAVKSILTTSTLESVSVYENRDLFSEEFSKEYWEVEDINWEEIARVVEEYKESASLIGADIETVRYDFDQVEIYAGEEKNTFLLIIDCDFEMRKYDKVQTVVLVGFNKAEKINNLNIELLTNNPLGTGSVI